MPAGYALAAYDEIDSTNEEAKRRGEAGERTPTWIWAKTQSAGRGRRGRSWTSVPGNLFCTLLIDPETTPQKASELSFVTALAVADTIDGLIGEARAELKWPNDVLVDGAKICGVLLESGGGTSERAGWLAIGIGINLATHPEGTPYPATHVGAWRDPAPEAGAALEILAARFDFWLKRWRAAGFAPVREHWLARARGLGEDLTARLGSRTLAGKFLDLDGQGALVLQTDTGEVHTISAGEVFFGR